MLMQRFTGLVVCIFLSACVTTSTADRVLTLDGADDAAGARVLEAGLRAAGQPVEPASDGRGVFVYRRGMATLLSPVLQTNGLDRIVSTRVYGPATGRGEPDLAALAVALNDQLNVGVFAVDQGAMVFQSQLTFLNHLTTAEVLAFVDWLDQAEQAIRRVDAATGTLILTAPL